MTNKEILELIKMKRENAYDDYYHYNRYMQTEALERLTGEYKSFIKDKINELETKIKTYNDLIIIIELNNRQVQEK